MTINYTSLLGLAKPVTGTETGQWGDVVNDEITSLLEDAVANAATISVTAGNVTLSTTNGSSNQARMATLIITGTPGTTRNVVAPSQAKIYVVVNQSDSAVVIKGAATTGITIAAGQTAQIVWNGSDFVEVGSYVHGNLIVNGNLTVKGNTTLGDAAGDSLTVNATVTSNLIFTDNTYDIGASGATRPRTIYAATSIFAPLMDATNLEVTNIKALDGTAAASIANSTGAITVSTLLNVDNLRLDGNTISSTDTNGNIVIAPNGTGQVQITNAVLDLTTIEVTNIKAKDGTAAMSIADSTGVVSITANPVLSGGTANGVTYLNGSKVLTSGSALTFDGTNFRAVANARIEGTGLGLTGSGDGAEIYSNSGVTYFQAFNRTSSTYIPVVISAGTYISQSLSGFEQARLTSSGLEIKQSQLIGYSSYAGIGSNGLAVSGNVGVGTASPAYKLDVNGRIRGNDVGLGSTSNWFYFDSFSGSNFMGLGGGTSLQTYVGGILVTTITSSGGLVVTPIAGGTAVFNENGVDADFRVEGDTDANLLFVDASTDRVGIGTDTPGAKLDVVGQSRVLYGTGATNTGDQSVVTVGATTTGVYASSYGAGLQFQVTNSSGGYAGSRIVSRLGADNNTANLVFQARNYGYTDSVILTPAGTVNIVGGGTPGSTQAVSFNGSAPVDSLVLNSSGNLGVGTASPSSYVTSGLAVYSSVNSTQTKLAVVNPNSGGSAGAVQTFISDSDQKLELTLTSTGWGDYGTIKKRSGFLSAYGNAGTYLTVAGQAGIIFGYGANPHSEAARITSGGNLLVGTTSETAGVVFKVTGATANSISHQVWTTASSTDAAYWTEGSGSVNGVATGVSGSATLFKINKDSGTSRSINAAGTINASGADYAEYMTKAGDFTVAKGDVVGINADGKLTNVFENAVSFVVKSTDPSYVGGDTWGVGFDGNPEGLEAVRKTVDRIAFAGQVPVNVMGATPGQYIIPVSDNGAIKGIAKDESNMTLAEYIKAVGKVIAVKEDGRALIIVKVA